MKDVYPSDEEFKNAFSNKQERSGPKIQYILKSLEQEEHRIELGKSAQEIEIPEGLTVEHVLPKNPSAEWDAVVKADSSLIDDSFCDRLGNLCLLSDVNRALGRKSFDDKRPYLSASALISTRNIAAASTWDRKSIEHRQAHMSKLAASVWRFQ